jgi:transcriptional regulator with XRE-family HTH domain
MTKKNIIIERGKRLQKLRKKVGLTRLAFAEQTGMSANTLKALELGDRELTSQKALLFSNLFSGLFSVSLGEDAHEASFEYLYYGKADATNQHKDVVINDNEDMRIQSEINYLMSNPSYIILKITDDSMAPYYSDGDVVAGKKIINKNQFSLYQGYICLMETSDGEIYLRRIIKSDGRKITACLLNTNHNQYTEIVQEYDVRSIAQALWHWHLSQLIRIPAAG